MGRNGRRNRKRRGRQLPLARFAAAYNLAIFLCFLGSGLILSFGLQPAASSILIAGMYLSAGFALNRLILVRLRWNENFANLAIVAREKLWTLILWPVTYPVLLGQLWVALYL
jgi:hypothetical protein